jgi:hypothetical protein
MTLPLTPQLLLAQKWAKELGNGVMELTAKDAEGREAPGFGLAHGPANLGVIERDGVLMVSALLAVDPALAKLTGQLPPSLQLKMLETVKAAFMDCPRVGWNIIPPTAPGIGQVRQFLLVELLRIEEGSVESFNRFSDAIQKSTTLWVRTTQVYAAMGSGPSSASSPPGYG